MAAMQLSPMIRLSYEFGLGLFESGASTTELLVVNVTISLVDVSPVTSAGILSFEILLAVNDDVKEKDEMGVVGLSDELLVVR